MSEVENQQSRFSDPQDSEVTRYRQVSGLAVTALILALFSPLAWADPTFWAIPAAAIVVALVALKRIARADPAMLGRKAAVAAMAIALFCAALTWSDRLTFRFFLDRQARQFAQRWFQSLRNGEPHKTHQLSEPPQSRLPLNDTLWEHYAQGTDLRRDLDGFLHRQEIRSLLALGREAHIRYYQTENIYRDYGDHAVVQVYAVTCQQEGEKISYFLRLVMKRHALPETGQTHWEMLNFDGGIRPHALEGEEEN